MVHEAMVLEYSGRHLAMIEFAASLKLLLYVSLIACIFVPWGLPAPAAGPRALRDRRRRLSREARRRRGASRRVRDGDRQDARVPRAGIPRRRLHARAARQPASLRGAEPMIDELRLRRRAPPRRRARARQPHHALSAAALCAPERLRAARLRARALGRLAGLYPGRAAPLHHRRDRARLQGDRDPGRAASDDRAPRHPSRDRDGGRDRA